MPPAARAPATPSEVRGRRRPGRRALGRGIALGTLAALLLCCGGAERVVDAEGHPAALGSHAGSYTLSPTLTWHTLDIDEAGFRYRMGGCMGLYEDRTGRVRVDGRRLVLLPDDQDGFAVGEVIGPTMLGFTWGPRRYLVPEDGLLAFCNAVNSGEEGRAGSVTWFVQQGGETLAAPGSPEVPGEARAWLLDQPIEAHVTALDERGDAVIATLDVGLRDGAFVGLRFHVKDGAGTFVVDSLSEQTCLARAEAWSVDERGGLELSTLARP
jgi:hypothetical protein